MTMTEDASKRTVLGAHDLTAPASPNDVRHAIQAARTNPASINDGGSQ